MKKTAVLLIVVSVLAATAAASEPETVAPGVTFHSMRLDEGPWALRVLEVDRSAPGVNIRVVLGDGGILGIEPLTRILERPPAPGERAVGAVNGDFYILSSGPFQGDPVGLCVVDGELVSSPVGRSALVFTADGGVVIDVFSMEAAVAAPGGASFPVRGVNQSCPDDAVVLLTPRFGEFTRPQEGAVAVTAAGLASPLSPADRRSLTVIAHAFADSALAIPGSRAVLIGRGTGRAFLESLAIGDRLDLSVAISPDHGPILQAVGGTPRIVRDGVVSLEHASEGVSQSFADTRHPRTAAGFDGARLWFVTVDGRQEGYSAGMSLAELAAFMRDLGAREAINLDGGGSTTMWIEGRIRNSPSDKRVRPIANGVVVTVGRE